MSDSAPANLTPEQEKMIAGVMNAQPTPKMSELALGSLTDPVFDGPPKEKLPTIALVTMTANRATIARLFESVSFFVNKAVILDTGSGEFTKSPAPFPLEVYDEPFVNFEMSRNRLMELAKDKADWLLLLDDDMGLTFETPPVEIKKLLDPKVGAYMLKHGGNPEYWVARLVRGDRLWKFKGVTHEYLEGGGIFNPKLIGMSIWHDFHHGREKFLRDLKLLTADIARDPNDYRTIYYLANTLRDLGYVDAAIRFFIMRTQMGGWDEEIHNSMYEAARLAKDPNAMQRAHAFRPTRAEPAAWLSGYYKFVTPDEGLHKFWESVRAAIPLPTKDFHFVIPFMYGPDFVSRLENYQ